MLHTRICGSFLLLIACFNYINLATARASRRLKEVGLRKSLGALRRMLIAQFLGESIIVAFISALLATLLAWIALPAFRTLVESPLSFSILPNLWIIIGTALGLVILIGVLAGAYPALIVSRFQPLQIFRPSRRGYTIITIRKLLVTIRLRFHYIGCWDVACQRPVGNWYAVRISSSTRMP